MGQVTLARIGDYQLLHPLGTGGMGEVWFAVSPTADRVAVKVIKQHLVESPEIRERFATEIESLKLVFGSRVARLEDADAYGDPAWLAVEYVPGATLRQHVDTRGPLTPALAAMAGAMLADGLAKVHHAGLLHRDLKPQNIILGPDGPKLIDFGLAVLVQRDNYLTEPGALVGTPAYMSPEQVQGERELTPAVDIYGLGATLVFALTGHNLYPASNAWSLLLRISDPDDLPDLTGVPAELAPLLGAMLAFDPGARPSLDAVRTRLLRVATAVSGAGVAELRREVGESTYDRTTELLVPHEFADPRQDPERPPLAGTDSAPDTDNAPGAGTDNNSADIDSNSTDGTDGARPPGEVAPPGVEPVPPRAPTVDVAWLVDQVRKRYARRSTLL